MQTNYEIIEYKLWESTDGRTASIYGSVPWTSAADRDSWTRVSRGFTIRNNRTNTVGLGRRPFSTRHEAEEMAARLNSSY